ncbi:MAG: hypothetical protein NVSMB57_06720 [Actinomycetota bacterium]
MKKIMILVALSAVIAISAVGLSAAASKQAPSLRAPATTVVHAPVTTGKVAPQAKLTSSKEAPETASPAEAPETSSSSETASGNEKDTHNDVGSNADHQCPPSCDTANGETP